MRLHALSLHLHLRLQLPLLHALLRAAPPTRACTYHFAEILFEIGRRTGLRDLNERENGLRPRATVGQLFATARICVIRMWAYIHTYMCTYDSLRRAPKMPGRGEKESYYCCARLDSGGGDFQKTSSPPSLPLVILSFRRPESEAFIELRCFRSRRRKRRRRAAAAVCQRCRA